MLASLCAGCLDEDSSPLPDSPSDRTVESAVSQRQLVPSDKAGNTRQISPSRMEFVDVASDAEINFQFFADVVPGRYFLPEVMGGGVGWIDFDVDGRLDLYAVNGRPLNVTSENVSRTTVASSLGNRLYRQTDGARFAEVASHAAADLEAYGQGVAVGDYDADGFDDLFLTSYEDETLLRNNGDGTFADVTAVAGTTDPHWSTSCVWLDLDDDQLLDLYVTNYMDVRRETHKICGYGGKPGYCGPGDHNGVADVVYRNQGDGTFVTATSDLGFSVPEARNGLGVLASDFDEDLIAEVYVANDMEPNFLFTRSLHGEATRYREIAGTSGCALGSDGMNEASMGVACGDLDGDGRPDLYLTHYYHTKNTLYRNLGGLLFDDQSRRSGVASATYERTGFGTVAADFDRDGDLDLFAANGHVLGSEQPPFEMEPGLLQNEHGQFSDVSSSAGEYFSMRMLGRGVGSADFDHDGDIDLAISHIDRPLALLANVAEPAGPFIGFELVSENRLPPVGGRVRVQTGEHSWVLPVIAGGSYLSSSDRRLFLGLGDAGSPVTVDVFWPSGKVGRYESLQANAYWRLYESGRQPERRRALSQTGQVDEI